MRGWGAFLVPVCLVLFAGAARADDIRRQAQQLRGASDYRVRLSAALNLARTHDPRAIAAITFALRRDGESTVRRVAALSLGKMVNDATPEDVKRRALKALQNAARSDRDQRVRAVAKRTLSQLSAIAARPAPERASARQAAVYVNVAAPSDLTRKVPRETARRMHETVQRTVRKHAPGYATSADAPLPTRAELTRNGTRGFYVGATISSVSVQTKGRYAEVACSVSVRVSQWTGRDGEERLVAGGAASATGNGRVLGNASGRGISDATRDCLLTVAEEVTARQVIPFLQRVASR
jgi:hypothetical protein